MPGRTSNRHSPSTRCRCVRRPTSSQPIQASRACRRSAHDANPTPPSQPCAESTRYRSCGPTNGPAPRGCSCAISVFQTRRCASVSTSTSLRSRSAPTVSGTSTAGATGCASTRGARRAPPPERRHRGSKTWPAASRSVNAAQQLARCNRPRPSRKSNASQTWSATCPRLSTPCETAPFTTSRRRARLPRRLRPRLHEVQRKVVGHGQA